MPLSLHARLLRLCELAYAMAPGTRPPPGTGQRVREIGLAGNVTTIGRTADAYGNCRDSAMVGRIAEGIVVAIRGTQPPRVTSNLANMLAVGRDWLNDGTVLGSKCLVDGGFVHNGFAGAAHALHADSGADRGVAGLVKTLAAGSATRVILTGHSKGGPVAQLVALLLRRDPALRDARIEVVTFAGARLGDAVFRTGFEAAGIPCIRYETCHDIVPRLPMGQAADPELAGILAKFGAMPTGGVLGFVPLGQPVVETAAAAAAWEARIGFASIGAGVISLAGLLAGSSVADIVRTIAAHSISAGSHYDNLLDTHAVA